MSGRLQCAIAGAQRQIDGLVQCEKAGMAPRAVIYSTSFQISAIDNLQKLG
jgi:hypothetical protein